MKKLSKFLISTIGCELVGITATPEIRKGMEEYRKIRDQVLLHQDTSFALPVILRAKPEGSRTNVRLKQVQRFFAMLRMTTAKFVQDIDPDSKSMDLRDYARYALKDGAMEEKRQLIQLFNNQLYIKDKTVISKA